MARNNHSPKSTRLFWLNFASTNEYDLFCEVAFKMCVGSPITFNSLPFFLCFCDILRFFTFHHDIYSIQFNAISTQKVLSYVKDQQQEH